jgi:hypothetical protein
MQTTEVRAFSSSGGNRREIVSQGTLQHQEFLLDREVVERAAQALFAFVFSRTDRCDTKQLWMNCDERTRDGFRGEATAVIMAVEAFLLLRDLGLGASDSTIY